MVSFRARAAETGTAEITWLVQAKGEKDSVRLVRQVQSPARLEAVALYGQTKSAEAHSLGSMKKARPDMGRLDVTLSSSALVGLQGGFEQLWDYPYLCTEQLSSQIFPLLLLEEMSALYGVKTPQDSSARIKRNAGLLLSRQRGDGGFGMWPESRRSHPWVSAYALWVLHEASSRGVVVSKNVFLRGTRYLKDISNKRTESELQTAAFAAFVLSRLGKADKSTVLALYEHLEEMPVESQVMLLWAASASGVREIQERLLPRVESAITLRGNRAEIVAPQSESWARSMGSGVRLTAISLSALLSARPQHTLAPALVRGLLDARDGQGWGSTQEAAFALFALDKYRRSQEVEEPDFQALVFLQEKLLGKQRFLGRSTKAQSFSVEMSKLTSGGALVFQQQGRGQLFFEARLKFARKELPTKGLESGFLVEKSYQPLESSTPLEAGVAVEHGELIAVEIKVLAPTQRRFVAIDDPLPAGLEAIDLSLDNAQRSLGATTDVSADGYAQAWHRAELRDDRVLYFIDDMPPGVYRYRYLARATTRGQFIVPPTFAKEMYQEEVYGRTGARSLQVR